MFDATEYADEIAERAEVLARRLLEAQVEYRRAAADAADAGYRPEQCFHGASLWVDYDVMCQWCEEGYVNEYSTVADIVAQAQDEAEGDIRHKVEREAEQYVLDQALAYDIQAWIAEGWLTPGGAAVL